MANRDPYQCAKAVQEFWNNERELIKQGFGTRNWSVQEQIEIMNFKPSGGERKNAAAPTYGQGQATESGMSYDKYEGQHMKSAEAHPDFQGNPNNIQALTRDEHQEAHGGDFRNPTNGYYDPDSGQITDFGNNPPTDLQPQQLNEAYIDTAEYQYIIIQDVLNDFEQNKADMQNPIQDNYENVLNDFDQKKAEIQVTNNQQDNTQDMTDAENESINESETVGEDGGLDAGGEDSGLDSGSVDSGEAGGLDAGSEDDGLDTGGMDSGDGDMISGGMDSSGDSIDMGSGGMEM